MQINFYLGQDKRNVWDIRRRDGIADCKEVREISTVHQRGNERRKNVH